MSVVTEMRRCWPRATYLPVAEIYREMHTKAKAAGWTGAMGDWHHKGPDPQTPPVRVGLWPYSGSTDSDGEPVLRYRVDGVEIYVTPREALELFPLVLNWALTGSQPCALPIALAENWTLYRWSEDATRRQLRNEHRRTARRSRRATEGGL